MASMSPRVTTAGITIRCLYNSNFSYNDPLLTYNYTATAGSASNRSRPTQTMSDRARVAAVFGGAVTVRERTTSAATFRQRSSTTMKGR